MVTADYDCDALLRKADSPVEGEPPTTLMTACYILMSIIIVLLIIILRRLNAFIYHFNIKVIEMHSSIQDTNKVVHKTQTYVNCIYRTSDTIKNFLESHIKDSINHITFSTNGITEELRYVTKCCKENKAKSDYVIKLLRNSSTNKNNKRTKPKTAKLEEIK